MVMPVLPRTLGVQVMFKLMNNWGKKKEMGHYHVIVII